MVGLVVFIPFGDRDFLDMDKPTGLPATKVDRQLGVKRNIRRAGLSEPRDRPDPKSPPEMGHRTGVPVSPWSAATGLGYLADGTDGNHAWACHDHIAQGLVCGSNGVAVSGYAGSAPGLCGLDALKIESRKNRRVIAGLFPTTRGANDLRGMPRRRNIGRGPDVIQSAPFVGTVPIAGTI